MSVPVLYDYFRSSACYRVRIALNLKQLPYRAIPIALLDGAQATGDYRARNPQGFVPLLEIDGHRLTQSLAIIDYLDACFPEPPLMPRDPAARAYALAMALVVACDIHPLNNLRVLNYLKDELGADKPASDAWYRHWVHEGLIALEGLAGRDEPFLGGEQVSVADICLVPQMFNARRFDVPLDDCPTLVRVDAALAALPAFAAAHPDRVKPGA